jgi:adenosylcobinamide kinase/adenosylcobinamide-phosphate guanylyltransferase
LAGLTLVIGGAASGKSVYAEGLVRNAATSRHYIATAQAFDDEMRVKIDRHIARRDAGWITTEAPLELEPVLAGLPADASCLLDCATLWLSNHLLADSDLERTQDRLLAALAACPARLVVVSNEVGHGVVPASVLGRRFRDAQGRLNIRLAQQADCVVQVTAGLPRALKGALP